MINDEQARSLTARWLQWAHSMPEASSPIADPTGQHGALNQPDDVWFLAGTSGGRAHRRCAVPAGRPLFFPLFNMWGQSDDLVCPQATGAAVLDGEQLPVLTVHNKEWIRIPAVAGKRFRKVSVGMWGFWSYHPGLPAGGHQLEFSGSFAPGKFWVEVKYELTAG